MSEEKIRIITYKFEEPIVRRFIPIPSISEIPPNIFKKNMESFLDMLNNIFSNIPKDIGDFELSELELYAEIDGEGKIGFLGTGLQVGAKAGFLIRLKRK